jgi:hypothetical protein
MEYSSDCGPQAYAYAHLIVVIPEILVSVTKNI